MLRHPGEIPKTHVIKQYEIQTEYLNKSKGNEVT